MYEDGITDTEGDLSEKSDNNEIPLICTVLDLQVTTPELNDNYVNSSGMFSRRNTCDIGKVIRRKRDASGNSVGRRNDNPILDMRKYRVDFDDEEVREITANLISESMYAACDDSGNEYLMMDSIVD